MKLLVQEMCARKGITRAELARRLGVSYNSLQSACSRNPRLSTIARLADALGCSPAELISDNPLSASARGELRCPRCGAPLALCAVEKREQA